jgi:hypothetical protein
MNPALLQTPVTTTDRGSMPKTSSAPLPSPHEQTFAITAGFWQSRALGTALRYLNNIIESGDQQLVPPTKMISLMDYVK